MKSITVWLWFVALVFCGLWSLLLWVCWPVADGFLPRTPEQPLFRRCQGQRKPHTLHETSSAGLRHLDALAGIRKK
jgi:hypothetical protein